VLNFVTTHLDYQYDDGRLFETQQLLNALKDVKGPLIVVGDFNDVPAGRAYQLMRYQFGDAWIEAAAPTRDLATRPTSPRSASITFSFAQPIECAVNARGLSTRRHLIMFRSWLIWKSECTRSSSLRSRRGIKPGA